MHELSVALALIDIATEEVVRLGAGRVAAVHLKAGPLAGIDAEALRFSFESASIGTPLDGAQLSIEMTPLTVWCEACDAERLVVSIACRRCGVCRAVAPRVVRGEELELVGLEVVTA
jgi:hydrogenase nickel incorporation protein HypA/HybF